MVRQDPENNEARAIFDLADFSDRRVLEIGCGGGRLTWRYADKAGHVVAIDPFEESIKQARLSMPDGLKDRLEFQHIGFDDFTAITEPSTFDIVLLSWSL